MTLLVWLVFAFAAIAVAYQLFQVFATWLFLHRTRGLATPATARSLPPVTLL